MNTRKLNVDLYRAALLSKAADCKRELLDAEEQQRVTQGIDGAYYVLRQVESALSRLGRGKYGLCMRCEEEIEQPRLEALPWTLFCAHCQRAVDLLHARASARRIEIQQAA